MSALCEPCRGTGLATPMGLCPVCNGSGGQPQPADRDPEPKPAKEAK